MKRIKTTLLFLLLFTVSFSFSQYPSIVLQRSFTGIKNIYNDARNGYLIIEEGYGMKHYSLWDQASQVMIGQLDYQPGNGRRSGISYPIPVLICLQSIFHGFKLETDPQAGIPILSHLPKPDTDHCWAIKALTFDRILKVSKTIADIDK